MALLPLGVRECWLSSISDSALNSSSASCEISGSVDKSCSSVGNLGCRTNRYKRETQVSEGTRREGDNIIINIALHTKSVQKHLNTDTFRPPKGQNRNKKMAKQSFHETAKQPWRLVNKPVSGLPIIYCSTQLKIRKIVCTQPN